MEVLVYEFFSSGGSCQWSQREQNASLLTEGAAMVAAVANDLARLENVHPVVMLDRRLDQFAGVGLHQGCQLTWVDSTRTEQQTFERLAAAADWTILVAPEWDDILLSRANRCLALGGRLLGPGLELIELAADKVALADYFRQHGLPIPVGCPLDRGDSLPESFQYPAILKPRFGAGSAGLQWIEDPADKVAWDPRFSQYRLEEYCPGTAVSVVILTGPGGSHVLPACRQLLSEDQTFQYRGGSLPIADSLAKRAEDLAERAADVLPDPLGYLGLDIVLGEEESGDFIIDVNPRLTTSYVGLSQLSEDNFAGMMLRVAQGESCVPRFQGQQVCFTASGSLVDNRVPFVLKP
jgi:predicted ATP-grasp superfamily ATP-dependent carboligase